MSLLNVWMNRNLESPIAMHWIAVGFGGALGAMARYALSGLLIRRFPLGTFLANLIGCLLIGLLMALSVRVGWPDARWRSFLITGFIGGLTTFSTFAYQTWELQNSGSLAWAGLNLFSNVLFGLLAVCLGIWLGECLCRLLPVS